MNVAKFENVGRSIELGEGRVKFSVEAGVFSKGKVVSIPFSEIQSVECREFKGIGVGGLIIHLIGDEVSMGGGGLRGSTSKLSGFKYRVEFINENNNLLALEVKRLIDLELLRYEEAGSELPAQITESTPKVLDSEVFMRVVAILFVLFCIWGAGQSLESGEAGKLEVSGYIDKAKKDKEMLHMAAQLAISSAGYKCGRVEDITPIDGVIKVYCDDFYNSYRLKSVGGKWHVYQVKM